MNCLSLQCSVASELGDGYTLSTSRIEPAQGLQMVLLIELECSRIVAKGLAARFLFHPLQNTVGQKDGK